MDYLKLPVPSGDFGHYDLVPEWGMMGNNSYGNCAWAGACHQIMLNCAESKTPVSFSTETVLKNYEVTGFDPSQTGPDGSNPTDNGTAVDALAKYWQSTGVVDDAGKRHKIVAYAALRPGDLRELWVATHLFQSVGLGFALPDTAEQQFAAGVPWDVAPGAQIMGGHYVPAFGRQSGLGVGVTWGRPHPFTAAFYRKYNTVGIVALSEEMLVQMRSVDGVDDIQLRKDMATLQAVA